MAEHQKRSKPCAEYLKMRLALVQNPVVSPPKDSQASAQKAPQEASPISSQIA